MGFVANFIRFHECKTFENRLKFDILNVGTFFIALRASGNLPVPVSYVLTGNLPVTYHQ